MHKLNICALYTLRNLSDCMDLLPGEVLGIYRMAMMPDDRGRQSDSRDYDDSQYHVYAYETFLFFHSKPTVT